MQHKENNNAPKTNNEAKDNLLNHKENLYARLPFTYRQVDIFIKIMIAFIAAILLIGILRSNSMAL